MATAMQKIYLKSPLERVWDAITCLENADWRSDLSKIQVLEPGKRFVEYTKSGYPTTFTITCSEPMRRYEFDMDNGNLSGHWTGLLRREGEGTAFEFTEVVTPKKWIMKPFVQGYLKKQQRQYLDDLKRLLGE